MYQFIVPKTCLKNSLPTIIFHSKEDIKSNSVGTGPGMSEIYRPRRKQENFQPQDVGKKDESNPIAIQLFCILVL